MSSFFPNCVKFWNNLSDELRNCDSISKFKRSIFSILRPPKKNIFDIHDPIGIHHIFRLRLELSGLKCHKKTHIFPNTPSDWCDCYCAPEDTFHFLFRCNSFINCRQNLMNDV